MLTPVGAPLWGDITVGHRVNTVFLMAGFSALEIDHAGRPEEGDTVLITGFGRFTVHDKAARVGRNPQTGEAITVAARRVVTFKYSVGLKEAVNAAARPATTARHQARAPRP